MKEQESGWTFSLKRAGKIGGLEACSLSFLPGEEERRLGEKRP